MKFSLRLLAIFAAAAAILAAVVVLPAQAQTVSVDDETWYSLDEDGVANVDLYFFWSETCPHCRHAHPYIMSLPEELPWLRLHALELQAAPENTELYVKLAEAVGQKAQYVPAFIYCGAMQAGYDEHETTGAALRQSLIDCQAAAQAELAPLARSWARPQPPGRPSLRLSPNRSRPPRSPCRSSAR